MEPDDRLLRLALRANATFSIACALLALLFAPSLAAALGIPGAPWLIALGVGLLGFAGFVLWLSFQSPLSAELTRSVIAGDIGWVVATIPVLAIGFLTGLGMAVAVGIAVAVGTFAALQTMGLRRITPAPREV